MWSGTAWRSLPEHGSARCAQATMVPVHALRAVLLRSLSASANPSGAPQIGVPLSTLAQGAP